jgi:hypothetical protein
MNSAKIHASSSVRVKICTAATCPRLLMDAMGRLAHLQAPR